MKRFLTILLLFVTVVAVTGCDDETETPAPVEETVEQPKTKSTAQLIEEIKAKRKDCEAKQKKIQKSLDKTECLLIKRIAQRDTAKSELNQFVYRTDKTPKEIKAELVKGKSNLDSQIWFQEIRMAWNNLKDLERDVVVFTRQEERLKATKIKLEQTIKELKRIEENGGVYDPGVDPELDRRLAEGEVIEQDSEWDKLTSGEQAEIDIKVDKLMDETIENNVSKIPGLELKSIDELPALPDIAAMVTSPDSPAQISLMGRVKNDCNKIVEKVQKEVAEYLEEKQPEAACSCWLNAIKLLENNIQCALRQFSVKTFDNYINALDVAKKETLRIMSKPYQLTLAKCVKDLENNDPDWDAIAESLEGLLRIKPTLLRSDVEILREQYGIIWSHITYLLNKNNRDAKVKLQRVSTVLNEYLLRKGGEKAGDRVVKTINGVEFVFRWAPADTFMMGSPYSEDDRSDDEEQHQVMLTNGFWMMETEVTQKQWKAIMGDNPSKFKSSDNLPVETVSWDKCQEFCKKCADLGLPVQLPTEAQWEYACRAGTTGAYAGDLDEMAWYSSNSGSKTHSVGTKKPNAWGLYDMHGNVIEWCADWYGGYSSDSVTAPMEPSDGDRRIIRGGSWEDSDWKCRSANRDSNVPHYCNNYLGFRCAMSITSPEN